MGDAAGDLCVIYNDNKTPPKKRKRKRGILHTAGTVGTARTCVFPRHTYAETHMHADVYAYI
jgi:hypothetical protein